jgi:hypothetical protein
MERQEIKFKIVRTNPKGLQYEFCNDVIITYDKENFYLQFGQIAPPQVSGKDELENFTLLGSIESQAISRIVIDKNTMPGFIRALQENYEKHEKITPLATEDSL